MRQRVFLKSKNAESDNLTILVFLVLFFVGCFYAANWFMGGALTEIAGNVYHSQVDNLKRLSGIDLPARELPPECAQEFKCKEPLNEETCPEIERAAYDELCSN